MHTKRIVLCHTDDTIGNLLDGCNCANSLIKKEGTVWNKLFFIALDVLSAMS